MDKGHSSRVNNPDLEPDILKINEDVKLISQAIAKIILRMEQNSLSEFEMLKAISQIKSKLKQFSKRFAYIDCTIDENATRSIISKVFSRFTLDTVLLIFIALTVLLMTINLVMYLILGIAEIDREQKYKSEEPTNTNLVIDCENIPPLPKVNQLLISIGFLLILIMIKGCSSYLRHIRVEDIMQTYRSLVRQEFLENEVSNMDSTNTN